MNKNFNKYVREAKKVVALLRLKNRHRMKVAQLCIKACTITVGGRRNDLSKTEVKKFAEKIGINHQTLYEWTRYYRYIYLKIVPDYSTEWDEFPTSEVRHLMKGLKKDTPESVVKNKFKKALHQKGPQAKFEKYCRVLDTIISHVSDSRKIFVMEDATLFEIVKRCRTIITFIEKEMQLRQKKIPRKFNDPKIDFSNFWQEEIDTSIEIHD